MGIKQEILPNPRCDLVVRTGNDHWLVSKSYMKGDRHEEIVECVGIVKRERYRGSNVPAYLQSDD
jgi:hypothetical protein